MSDLPTGTVTLLLTDIEGSTRLLHELGQRYAGVLAEHRRVVRDAFQANGGVEVDTQGDAFFYAFARATDAAAAAVDAQRRLSGGPVGVRVGIHTGEPTLTAEGYVGADVHRAARIMSVGHGGQILLSQATRELLDDDVELRDLGEHRLKDLGEPQRIFQLGARDFPPLKSLNFTNLPVQATRLVGRERELAEAGELLLAHRLISLVGPGGTGKTRLGLQLAANAVEAFTDGVYWVPLAAVRDPHLVEPAIAGAVGAKNGVSDHLRSQRALLLLDNFEQVIEAAPAIAELLRETQEVKLLVTSRAPLRVAGEHEYPVPPLPDDDAVALFLDRARAVQPSFELDEDVEEICRRVDGLPLAIELAAARVKILPPRKILERLEQRLPLLTGGGRDLPERQRTLRTTIEWSYELCLAEEQSLFRRLSVFAGGCALEAAEEVCEADLDTLQSLVDKNVLRSSAGRFFMLETIREYGIERLDASGEAVSVRDRHAGYYAGLVDSRWIDLARGDTPEWRATVRRELPNLHTATEWSLQRGETENVLAIGAGIWPFWGSSGYGHQARGWLERALESPSRSPARRGHALVGLGNFAGAAGDHEVAKRAHEESLAIFRDLDEPRMVAANLTELADIAVLENDLETARRLAEESAEIRRDRMGSVTLGRALSSLATISIAERDYARARELLEEAIERWSLDLPDSMQLVGYHDALGETLRRRGDHRASLRAFAEAIRIAVRRDEPPFPSALEGIALVWASLGDSERAARIAGAADRVREQLSYMPEWRDRPVLERLEPAWSEGRAMTNEETVEYALRDIE
jgi:predicted ATPase